MKQILFRFAPNAGCPVAVVILEGADPEDIFRQIETICSSEEDWTRTWADPQTAKGIINGLQGIIGTLLPLTRGKNNKDLPYSHVLDE